MGNSRRLRFVVAIIAMAVFFAGPFVQTAMANGDQEQDTIRVGVVAPFSGAASRYGGFFFNGAQLAVKEINATGGVLGKQIELFRGDSQGTPAAGVSAAQRLIDQNEVSVILGDILSSVTLALQPVAENADVLLLNVASSNPQITYRAGVGGFENTYRNYPTDEVRALVVLKYLAEELGKKDLAVLSIDSDYGRGAIDFTRKYLKRFNAQFLSEDYFKDSEVDFRPVLAKIQQEDAEAIVFYGLSDNAPILARQMIEMGLDGKVIIAGAAEFFNLPDPDTTAKAFEGAVSAEAWLPSWDSPRNKKFLAAYDDEYKGEAPTNHSYQAWEGMYLLAEAIKAANSTEIAKLRDALSSITYEGAMGKVRFDDHNQAILPMVLYQIESGKPVIKGVFASELDYPD